MIGTLRKFNYREPARLKALFTALCAVAVALGYTLPGGIDGAFEAVLVILAVVVPAAQGEVTRRSVYSPATARDLYTTTPPVDHIHDH